MITVAVPILNRPRAIQGVMERFEDVLFLPDETDTESVSELDRLGASYSFAPPAPDFGAPTFPSKINHAYNATDTAFLLYAADDVFPEPGWLEAAMRHLADPSVGVLATNDRLNPAVQGGRLATHGIVRRAYVEQHGTASFPGSGPIFNEGYRHVCCDTELSRAAQQRGAFKYAPDVILAHHHPFGGTAEMDATYTLGYANATRDRRLYNDRLERFREGR